MSDKSTIERCQFFDKNGVELNEFDVVKVFHFTGARRKKHYMYKWIRLGEKGGLCMQHLDDNSSSLVSLRVVCKKVLNSWIWADAEIVQSNNN